MLANLVKKDFLLVKKSIMAFLGISILVPLIIIILMRNMTQIQGKMCIRDRSNFALIEFIKAIASWLYNSIRFEYNAIFSIRFIKSCLLKRTSIFHLPDWSFPPMMPPLIMPDLLVRFKKKVEKPKVK